eukprot:gene9122-biopygen13736
MSSHIFMQKHILRPTPGSLSRQPCKRQHRPAHWPTRHTLYQGPPDLLGSQDKPVPRPRHARVTPTPP